MQIAKYKAASQTRLDSQILSLVVHFAFGIVHFNLVLRMFSHSRVHSAFDILHFD
jgi:hypothetical protein